MTDAESDVKKGRIRHAYSRKEIFHRFVHSSEYAYSPASSYKQICCIGNYLLRGNLKYAVKTASFIEDLWYNYKDRCIAIIDRINKRIIIKSNYTDICSITRALPDYYNIFYSNKQLEYNVLTDCNTFLKLHAEFLISTFINYADNCYRAIYSNKVILNTNINDILCDKHYFYSKVVEFINRNEVYSFAWYDKQLFNTPITIVGNHHPFKITAPTLKQIFDKNIFTDEEKLILNQKEFYTKYCYGFGIPYKDVISNWNKQVCFDAIAKYIKRKFAMNKDWFTNNEHSWNDYIKRAVENVRTLIYRENENSVRKSTDNFDKAVDKALKTYNVNDWREHKERNPIKYNKYYQPSNKALSHGKLGYWSIVYVPIESIDLFPTIALRLSINKTQVETSKNTSVSILEAVKLFNMFTIGRNNNPSKTKWTVNDFGNTYVDIYKLKRIEYTNKTTNKGIDLEYKTWLFEIGCHKIWLDDIDDFIHYYHLEDLFLGKTNKDSI